ncbi:Lrp/AsnC family transcriptional regulator [Candidatus Woesearchaeota archaeon]|nr:Lrp/AsnC family transcriptional regulator [Candidatus Woesearchaeota archaeon]
MVKIDNKRSPEEPITIDKTDRRILYELDLNGRATYSEIGKKVRLSKQSVKERISNLEKIGIIRQYFALIDVHRMGYTFYRIDLKLQNVTGPKEKYIVNYILKLPKVISVLELHGNYDLAVLFLTKDIIETDNNIKNIKWKFNKYIKDISFSVITTHTRYKYGFLIDKKQEDKEVFMGRELAGIKLSPVENKVLTALGWNGRISLTTLAKQLGKSISSIKNAIKNLKDKKILLGYTTLIASQALGYLHYKVFINFQNPSQEKERKLEYYFRISPNIIYMTKSLGRSDIECEIIVRNITEFKKIIREMQYEFSSLIRDIDSYLVLNQLDTSYYPV